MARRTLARVVPMIFAATLLSGHKSFPAAARISAQAAPAATVEPTRRAGTFLVLPLENLSRQPKLDWLKEGLAELTIERLARLGQSALPREEWQAALDRLGLPASARFSRATMLKIAEEADADWVVFGQYRSDGKTFAVTARLLHVSPPGLLPAIEESGVLSDLMELHARLIWSLLREVQHDLPLSENDVLQKLPRLRLDAFEMYIRGLLSAEPDKKDQRLRLLREAARLEPTWEDPAFTLGETYFARRDCGSALPWLSLVPPAHQRGLEARFAAGVCHLLRNDPARAEAVFAELAEQAPASGSGTTELPEALNNLGVARARLGKSREAAEAFARATKADPDDPDYWFNLGLTEMRLNDPATAVEPFREVLRRQPRDAKAHALLVKALKESGRATEASVEEEAWSRQGGKAEASPSLSADALAQLDRIKMRVESAAAYSTPDAAAGGEPGAPPAHRPQNRVQHLTRGRQLLAAGKLEDAEREFLAALSAAPFDPVAHRGLAEVYRRQGRPDDAVRELRASLEVQDDSATRTALARLYVEQNRPAEAREELRLALKLDPDNAEARQLLAELQSRTGPGDRP